MKTENEIIEILEREKTARDYWMNQVDIEFKLGKKEGISHSLGMCYDTMNKHDACIEILHEILGTYQKFKEFDINEKIEERKKTYCYCEKSEFTRNFDENIKPICSTCGKIVG